MAKKDKAVISESKLKQYWRPAMAWQYLAVCITDFIIFPAITQIYVYLAHVPYVAWEPLTLKVGGLYHMAMATIIGVSAWTRGQEKIRRIDDNIFLKNEDPQFGDDHRFRGHGDPTAEEKCDEPPK